MYVVLHTLRAFRFPLLLPCMMHLCITQCTYWTPLARGVVQENKCVDAIRSGGRADSLKVTSVHKKYITVFNKEVNVRRPPPSPTDYTPGL